MSVVRIHQGAQTVRVDADWPGGEIGKREGCKALGSGMTSEASVVGSSPILAQIQLREHGYVRIPEKWQYQP